MAGASLPGPLGIGSHQPALDAGTSAAIATPPPGPVRTLTLAQPGAAPDAAPAEALDPAIEALDLAATARAAAYALKKAHPAVVFTSGRRSTADQARAMAGNVVKNRKWIEATYASSDLRTKCQQWVDDNPGCTTQDDIAAGLLAVLDGVDARLLGSFSRHLSGEAFDVQPVERDAEAIKTTIRGLAGLDTFLDKEGGLVRWHAQF